MEKKEITGVFRAQITGNKRSEKNGNKRNEEIGIKINNIDELDLNYKSKKKSGKNVSVYLDYDSFEILQKLIILSNSKASYIICSLLKKEAENLNI